MTEQLVNFTGMTRTELLDFGGETLILLLYQLPLDSFLFVVVFLDHACRYFCLDHACGLAFYLLWLFILFACMTRNPPYAVFILHLCFLCT